MQRIPLETQTLYAELLEQLTALEAHRSIGSLPGGFTTKEVKGETYYYFQYSEPGGERKQVYIGKAGPELTRTIERFTEEKAEFQADQKNTRRLCAQLRAGEAVVSSHAHARVLQALADAGVFRMGGVLVGTHAFALMGNVLGYHWDKPGLETQDVDIAREKELDLALPNLPTADIPGTLDRLEMGFLPVPALDPRRPSTSFKVRKSALRVDILTTAKNQKEEYRAIQIPKFNTAALALKYLDYLIESPIPAAVIDSSGILVQIPDPARYAFHKLIVAGQRPVSEHPKKAKDLRQASLLITVLAEERPGDLLQAWDSLIVRGRSWEKGVNDGMEAMRKLYPEAPNVSELLDHGPSPS